MGTTRCNLSQAAEMEEYAQKYKNILFENLSTDNLEDIFNE
jgi:hypothetical protein